MNILICTAQVPFVSGGAELHVTNLKRALTEAGHTADVVALPFKWYPPREIIRSALAWRMLDVTEANGKPVDMVIGMVGALIGGWLFAHEGWHAPISGLGGTIFIAFIGALILLVILRLFRSATYSGRRL